MLFLSESFTRPKVMKALAKAGFTQSYSYFTWRNEKQELIDYFTELTQTDVRDYMRANLFTNTPDINPYYLQTSGRAGFKVATCWRPRSRPFTASIAGLSSARALRCLAKRNISIPRNMRSRSGTGTAPVILVPISPG